MKLDTHTVGVISSAEMNSTLENALSSGVLQLNTLKSMRLPETPVSTTNAQMRKRNVIRLTVLPKLTLLPESRAERWCFGQSVL